MPGNGKHRAVIFNNRLTVVKYTLKSNRDIYAQLINIIFRY